MYIGAGRAEEGGEGKGSTAQSSTAFRLHLATGIALGAPLLVIQFTDDPI